MLTLAGRDEQGRLRLTIPNLMVRSLYAERLYDALVPEYEDRETRRAAADRFYAYADLEPLCDFIEQRFFKVFDNRNLRWSNELTVKTAFLTLLFNDTFYIMDSETAIDRGYSDLSLILRPNMRKYKGTLKNPMLNTFHGDAHKSRFSNALIIMELRTRT